jgi:replicative DNA helicase
MFKEHVHFDKDIEGAVLGAFLLEKHAYARTRGILTADCFYISENKVVFDVITEMWEQSYPIDIFTVMSKIARSGKSVVNGVDTMTPYYITRLTNCVVSTANLEVHALILRQLYAEREFVRIRNLPNDTSDDVLDRTRKMQDELFKITQIKVTNDWKDISEVVVELHEHMDNVKDKEIIGVPTGFSDFDLVTSGFCEGQLIILAARPSVGKSAFLGSLCLHAANIGKHVGIISLEMSNSEIGARFGSLVSDTEFYKIFRNKFEEDREREHVHRMLNELAEKNIKISDSTNVSINDIRAKVSNLQSKGQLDILFVDYLQLLETDESDKSYSREQEVSKMSRGFKLMAREFKIPIVVLAQLNRESEKAGNKKPQLHHLRESGSIEQDADGVVFLHRDFKSGILVNAQGQSTEHEADLIIAKWRNGELKEIKIGFEGAKMKFYDMNARHQAPAPVIKQTNILTYRNYTEPNKQFDDGL